MSDKRGLDELIIIMRQPCNALVITLQLGVNCRSFVPPCTVRGSLHLFSYPRGCKIPKDRVVERL